MRSCLAAGATATPSRSHAEMLGWADPVLERFEIDEVLTKSCGWVWWHENVLSISDRPSALHRDVDGHLHCEIGPSISYRDGWALYHWHGVLVPAYVIERPQEISVAGIDAEQNAEVRRVMVKVRNSTPEPDGSVRDYWLRVPPDLRTARAAVAWTFGLEPTEYAPAVET